MMPVKCHIVYMWGHEPSVQSDVSLTSGTDGQTHTDIREQSARFILADIFSDADCLL